MKLQKSHVSRTELLAFMEYTIGCFGINGQGYEGNDVTSEDVVSV